MDEMVMVLAEQRQVGQVGGAPVRFPPSDVVGVHEDGIGATGEAAVPITPHDLAALGLGGVALLSTFVHGVALVVVNGDDQGAVAGQTPYGLGADEPVAFELT
jgi:hypothetical protein